MNEELQEIKELLDSDIPKEKNPEKQEMGQAMGDTPLSSSPPKAASENQTEEEILRERGRLSRQRGILFEVKVREDLESKGWIITKWMNTVDFERDRVGPARRKWNPFTKSLSIGTGFPDLLCYKKNGNLFEVIGVEVKTNGLLDKFEKGQALWYLEKGIIPRILIAKKVKCKEDARKTEIEYIDFKEKYFDKLKADTKK